MGGATWTILDDWILQQYYSDKGTEWCSLNSGNTETLQLTRAQVKEISQLILLVV